MKLSPIFAFGVGAALCASATAQAPSQRSHVRLGASNTQYAMSNGSLLVPTVGGNESESTNGSSVNGDYAETFGGNNAAGDFSEMDIDGQVFARGMFGSLRTRAIGTLSNSFYNAENAPYMNSETGDFNPDGTPDIYFVDASASWSDNVWIGGTAHNYHSTWLFHIDGFNHGDWGFSYFTAQIGNNAPEFISLSADGTFSIDFRSSAYILGSTPETVRFSVYSTFQPQTRFISEGGTVSGGSDFSNTITFMGVELRDDNGNLVNETITSASGYQYEVVPEPASMLALGLGVAALVRRRKTAR